MSEANQIERPVMQLVTVAVLFAREDSHYKTLPQCDVYDMARDARTYDGPHPVVAHPPCRAWGRLKHMANPRPDEKNLARLSVALVREFGGVIEHPARSGLWAAQGLPYPGERDKCGGWTLPIAQHWWGHNAEKKTWLYIVGCEPSEIPEMPMVLGVAPMVVGNGSTNHPQRGDPGWRPEIPRSEREHTPPELAQWLVDLAERCKRHNAEITAAKRAG